MDAEREYLVASGILSADGTVESHKFHRLMLPVETDDGPGSGAYSLELRDESGATLYERRFEVVHTYHQSDSPLFAERLPYDPDTTRILLKHGDDVLETTVVSAHIPQVAVSFPNGGESVSGEQTITWTATERTATCGTRARWRAATRP